MYETQDLFTKNNTTLFLTILFAKMIPPKMKIVRAKRPGRNGKVTFCVFAPLREFFSI